MPDMPEVMHTCLCGYSLQAASDFLDQIEISRMMLGHIESMHPELAD